MWAFRVGDFIALSQWCWAWPYCLSLANGKWVDVTIFRVGLRDMVYFHWALLQSSVKIILRVAPAPRMKTLGSNKNSTQSGFKSRWTPSNLQTHGQGKYIFAILSNQNFEFIFYVQKYCTNSWLIIISNSWLILFRVSVLCQTSGINKYLLNK